MKLLVLFCIAALLSGCKTYREETQHWNPDGTLKTSVSVRYRSFLMNSEASALRTETQTEDFIRTVGADNVRSRGDNEMLEAGGDAAGKIIGSTIRKGLTAP